MHQDLRGEWPIPMRQDPLFDWGLPLDMPMGQAIPLSIHQGLLFATPRRLVQITASLACVAKRCTNGEKKMAVIVEAVVVLLYNVDKFSNAPLCLSRNQDSTFVDGRSCRLCVVQIHGSICSVIHDRTSGVEGHPRLGASATRVAVAQALSTKIHAGHGDEARSGGDT